MVALWISYRPLRGGLVRMNILVDLAAMWTSAISKPGDWANAGEEMRTASKTATYDFRRTIKCVVIEWKYKAFRAPKETVKGSGCHYDSEIFLSATAFIQYRSPEGGGPSGKTWPK